MKPVAFYGLVAAGALGVSASVIALIEVFTPRIVVPPLTATEREALAMTTKINNQPKAPAPVAAKPAPKPKPFTLEMAIGCGILARKGLKDPDSFKQLNSAREVQASRRVDFTATNGFGGRVRGSFSCLTFSYLNS